MAVSLVVFSSDVSVGHRGQRGTEARRKGCPYPKEDEGEGHEALCRLCQGSVVPILHE